jgi:integrase
VAVALEDWLSRIEHSVKPSMARNWRNYSAYYVNPYIGNRDVRDISGEVCDALYKKLLAEGRVKAKPKTKRAVQPVHTRRLGPDGRVLLCRPYRYDSARCYRRHAENDPVIGQPIRLRKLGSKAASDKDSRKPLPPGLEPKTVVNTHRMLHRAWEEFTAWGWAKRNVVAEAHPPRVPRKSRRFWTVAQLRAFLQRARHDRFFALWVLEATTGMRRSELAGSLRDLLDLEAGTLDIGPTRVVVDGRVIESDGKTENAQHVLALDPFTVAVLTAHVEMVDREREEFGPDYHDLGLLFCWENGLPPHPDTITSRFKKLSRDADLPDIDLHDVRRSYLTAGRKARIDWKVLSQRVGHSDVAFTMRQYVETDLEADREVANILAELIIGGALSSAPVAKDRGGIDLATGATQKRRPGRRGPGRMSATFTDPCTNLMREAAPLFEERPLPW